MTTTSPNSLKLLLVGSHFNPPAKTILLCLRNGTEVTLRREPENPYDEFAIGVYVGGADVEWSELDKEAEDLKGYGLSLDELRTRPEFKLGHVGASGGKPLAKASKLCGEDLSGTREILRGVEGREELPKGRLEFRGDSLTTIEVTL